MNWPKKLGLKLCFCQDFEWYDVQARKEVGIWIKTFWVPPQARNHL